MSSSASQAQLGSEAWCRERFAACAGLPARPGVEVRVCWRATGGPDGPVSWHTVVRDGRVVAVEPGADPDAEVTLTAPWDDAVAIADGALDANAAFMQGRLKTTGPTGPLLGYLALQTALRRG